MTNKLPAEKKKKTGRGILLLIVLILSVALVYLATKTFINKRGNTESSREQGSKNGPVFAVITTYADIGSITDYIDVNGNVSSRSSVKIFPDTKGILKSLYVSVGDFVRVNQLIAEIDPSKPGTNFALSPVRARIAGTITSLKFGRGDTVTLQSSIATIDDLRSLQIISHVPEKFISRVYKGMDAEVEILSMPGRILYLNVDTISPVIDPVRRSLELKINIPESVRQDMKAGMYARVLLAAEVHQEVITLPVDCILRGTTEHVYVVEDNIARKRNVRLGLTVNDKVEIIEGVEPGETVVLRGHSRLEDGTRVRIISAADTEES